jgi:hypothetical protein
MLSIAYYVSVALDPGISYSLRFHLVHKIHIMHAKIPDSAFTPTSVHCVVPESLYSYQSYILISTNR